MSTIKEELADLKTLIKSNIKRSPKTPQIGLDLKLTAHLGTDKEMAENEDVEQEVLARKEDKKNELSQIWSWKYPTTLPKKTKKKPVVGADDDDDDDGDDYKSWV